MSERGRVLVKMRSVVDRELAEVKPVLDRVVDEALRRGGLSVDEAAELLRGTEVAVGGRRYRLSYVLVRGASESLQARGGAPMYKFNMMPALSCPGAGACVVECYALHGHFVRGNVQSLNAAAHAFVDYVIGRVSREAGVEKAAAVLGALLAGAVKAEAPPGSIIRLHEAGDFHHPVYIAAWLGAAKMLPDYTFYTYTKSFPNVLRGLWERALDIYRAVWGGDLPANFSVNVSATADNRRLVPDATKAFKEMGVAVPAVFFYVSADLDKYVGDVDELAQNLLRAARDTAGRILVVEFEHGVSRQRTAKSAEKAVEVVERIVDAASRSGMGITVAVPLAEDGDVRAVALKRIAEAVGRRSGSARTVREGDRTVVKFAVGGGEEMEVFIEPAGRKQCNICTRCVAPRPAARLREEAPLAEAVTEVAERKRRRAALRA